MNKRVIKLKQKDLYNIINESVKRILNENKVINNVESTPNGREYLNNVCEKIFKPTINIYVDKIDNNFIYKKFLNKLNIEVEEDVHLILTYEYNEKDDSKCCYISKLRGNNNGCYTELLTYITIEEFIRILSNYSYEGGKFVRNNTFKY
jgi:hypothetical protein